MYFCCLSNILLSSPIYICVLFVYDFFSFLLQIFRRQASNSSQHTIQCVISASGNRALFIFFHLLFMNGLTLIYPCTYVKFSLHRNEERKSKKCVGILSKMCGIYYEFSRIEIGEREKRWVSERQRENESVQHFILFNNNYPLKRYQFCGWHFFLSFFLLRFILLVLCFVLVFHLFLRLLT